MAAEERGRSGGPNLPWASVFDPAANARALADVQAQGLRAAGELVERLVRSVDGERARRAGHVEPDAPAGVAGEPASPGDASRLVEVWIDLLRRTAESFGRLTSSPGPGTSSGEVAVDVATGAASGELRVELGGPTAVTEVWLHNGTGSSVGPLGLHCGVLRSSDGVELAAAVTFDPATLEELPPRSSRGVVVAVAASGPVVPGTYRTIVQASGLADLWLPLVVVAEGAP